MSINTDKMRTKLIQKGFVRDDTDHRKYVYFFEGRQTRVWTKISHGSTETIGENNLHDMVSQMHLHNKMEIIDFVDCRFSKEMVLERYLSLNLVHRCS
jgi:predicted transcriptional regulator